ncbi:MAG TPA: alpha/beta hydrolase fold domain-containing protein [Planctomycetota bacterium]|jgi:acetyl esterase/lipase
MIARRFAVPAVLLFIALIIRAEEPATTATKDISYKTGDGLSEYEQTRCKLDLYAPDKAKNLPVVVWFHGGGLTGGDKKGAEKLGRVLASEGLVFAAANYRLSPKATYPAYLEDAAAAVAWTIKHAGEYGGNAKQVFISGHSAGGYLTAMLGTDERWLKAQNIALADIAGLIPVSGQTLTHFTIRQERGIPKTTLIVDDAAPLYHARKDMPPMLILYAEKDMALRAEENVFYFAALKAAGNKQVTAKEIAGHDHGSIGEKMFQPADAGRAALGEFVKQTAAVRVAP